MSDEDEAEYEYDFGDATTDAAVQVYQSSRPIFEAILREVRELSRKKPEATMSSGKVKIVNRVLTDLLVILKDEPTGKYLEILNDETLPQVSDAVLAMVQFETALKAFFARYYRHEKFFIEKCWITEELIATATEDPGEDG